MYLDGETYRRIDNSVKELMEDYRIESYPIQLKELAKKMGITLVAYSYASKFGINQPDNLSDDAFTKMDDNIVFYNDSASIERIRFSVAHEIGHIWLEHKRTSRRNEAEANHFAGYLLAPTPVIVEQGFEDAFDIAEFFQISYEAACCALRRADSRKSCGAKREGYEYEIINLCHCEGGG